MSSFKSSVLLFSTLFALLLSSCQRDLNDLDPATGPTIGEVFIDAFSGGLDYAAFGGSVVTAFDVDNDVAYEGSSSMRIAIPDANDPLGTYAGGVYYTSSGRDLSGFNVLSFYAKSSKNAIIDVVGIGNDLGENRYDASVNGLAVNSNWQKYYIPIPDPSKLTAERGMFYYAEGPEEEQGYTIWFDEVRFESLGTILAIDASIQNGEDQTIVAETNDQISITGSTTFNLPNGIDQNVNSSAAYFEYNSTNPSVATVGADGVVNVQDAGTTVITATLNGEEVEGSLRIISTGSIMLPATAAPTPDENPNDVLSIFSNQYVDVPVDFYNGYWEFSTTQSEIRDIQGDDALRYTQLNFVGIQFTAPTIDISDMTHFHIDIFTFNETELPNDFKVLLVDLGPDGTFDGSDNTSHELTFTSPTLQTESWFSLDIPLDNFLGLTGRNNVAQIVLSGTLPTVFVDNMYFYKGENTGGGPTSPEEAAPTPTDDPSVVLSLFSDSYTNVAGTNLNPDWGQETVVSEQSIQGNNTLVYSGLNYQGMELGAALDVSGSENLHIDYWSANSGSLQLFLISPGPLETAFNLPVPTTGWNSLDIPLSSFVDVNLTEVFQLKFEGSGTIYIDNLYFKN